jgi:hypothetical protein
VPQGPITIERVIPPQWLGLTPKDLKWEETTVDHKKAYHLSREEAYVNIVIDKRAIVLDLEILGYHLERTSIRGINPEKWSNWAMLYLDAVHLEELTELLKGYLPKLPSTVNRVKLEKQQGGKEVTYYIEVPVLDFSMCLGCFDLAQKYLYVKAQEHCKLYPQLSICKNKELKNLRLRLKYSSKVNTFAKVGIAKISGKRSQIMVKLASTGPKITIQGILKEQITGKARGELTYCDHVNKRQYLALDLPLFYNALVTTKGYLDKLSEEERTASISPRCYSG